MGKIEKYESAILSILKEYAVIKYANIKGGNQLIVDRENRHYQVLTLGWNEDRYIHDCPLHFDIIGEKVWVQQNMTEWDVAKMLEDQGVPKEDIVIGFLSTELRAFSEYAAG